MDFNELVRTCASDSKRWFGNAYNSGPLVHHSLAMAGEVGEFCNIVKKIDRGSLSMHDATVQHKLRMELLDIIIYAANLADVLHVDVEKMYMHVRAENEKRFGKDRANGTVRK